MKFNKRQKKALKLLTIGIAWVLLIGIILFKLLIPLVLSILGMLLLLWLQYQSLDTNFKFFGTFVFLIIGWKIFEAICLAWMKIIDSGLTYQRGKRK